MEIAKILQFIADMIENMLINKQFNRNQMIAPRCIVYYVARSYYIKIGITIIITLTMGTISSWMVCSIFDQIGVFGQITYHFPVKQILLFVVALFIVQMIFSIWSSRYLKKHSLVERIKATE